MSIPLPNQLPVPAAPVPVPVVPVTKGRLTYQFILNAMLGIGSVCVGVTPLIPEITKAFPEVRWIAVALTAVGWIGKAYQNYADRTNRVAVDHSNPLEITKE